MEQVRIPSVVRGWLRAGDDPSRRGANDFEFEALRDEYDRSVEDGASEWCLDVVWSEGQAFVEHEKQIYKAAEIEGIHFNVVEVKVGAGGIIELRINPICE
jgi:hypothetical protein